MNSVMTLGVVLAVFRFDAAVAQEGYLGQDHDKWHHSFYQTPNALIPKVRAAILPIVAPPQGDRSEKRKKYAPQ
jgi:hypothetical protein